MDKRNLRGPSADYDMAHDYLDPVPVVDEGVGQDEDQHQGSVVPTGRFADINNDDRDLGYAGGRNEFDIDIGIANVVDDFNAAPGAAVPVGEVCGVSDDILDGVVAFAE